MTGAPWEGRGQVRTALLVPGFLDSVHSPQFDHLDRALDAIGVRTVREDSSALAGGPRGYSRYRASAHFGELRRLLSRLPDRRLALVGHCNGAHLALLAAARDPRVTDVVALMPPSRFIWPDDYRPERDTWRAERVRDFVRSVPDGGSVTITLPHSVVRDALQLNLRSAVRGLRARVLFVAGGADETIPLGTVAALHDRCGSPDRELVVLPDVEHDYHEHPEQIELVSSIVVEWLLGGPTS